MFFLQNSENKYLNRLLQNNAFFVSRVKGIKTKLLVNSMYSIYKLFVEQIGPKPCIWKKIPASPNDTERRN